MDEIPHHDITSKLIMSSTFLMVASRNGQGKIKLFKVRENSGNFICAVDYMFVIFQDGCYLSVCEVIMNNRLTEYVVQILSTGVGGCQGKQSFGANPGA